MNNYDTEYECDHTDDNGYSTLVFPKHKRINGLYGSKIKCYCTKCHKTIEIQNKEYEYIIEGEIR